MKIIAAPNSFKGSLSAPDAARAIKNGVLAACPDCEVLCIPVADGGDGFAEVIDEALPGESHEVLVHDSRMQNRKAAFLYNREKGMAFIEMAKASGLALLPERDRDPTQTTTFGTGELILAALDLGAERIVIGLGGSATCDGGIGMASALGYRFLDPKGNQLLPVGKSLATLHSIDTSHVDRRLALVQFTGVCDVTNPLYGKNGAAFVYAPQKGATAGQVELLDMGLAHLAAVISRDMGIDVHNLAGGGAAGGLGAGLHCFLNAKLEKGIDLVLDLVDFRQKIQDADLVITGEGQIDYQTKFDKAPAGVARISSKAGIPCIAICGSIGERVAELHDSGINGVFSICTRPMPLAEAMNNSFELLAFQTEQIVRAFILGKVTGSR